MADRRSDPRHVHRADPHADPHAERVLIVDFGSQVTQLIARRVRESGVYSEIHPYDRVDAGFLKSFRPKAVILSGGPASVHPAGTPRAPDALWTLGVPVLGICYGQMAMQAQLGGRVEGGATREFGRAALRVTGASKLFAGVSKKGARPSVWMSHGDRVIEPAPGFTPVATSKGAPFAVLA
ncbi:MAG: GMP synthase (glutamine-hydrolyzing), partial [Candidatus Omnitrophica bacterium]|nr:GMP synthase (glutamine-hydrolyzing) [Candidatus Omnitrophota bacterium]